MECGKCGTRLGNMQVHPEEICFRQQEINRKNMGLRCQWCDERHVHKDGCPRKSRDLSTAIPGDIQSAERDVPGAPQWKP